VAGALQKVRFTMPIGEQRNCVAFAHNGKYILTGSDTTVRLWDVATGKMIRESTGYQKTVNTVAFSPDDKFILSGSADGTARIWDVSSSGGSP
jgi:WD40 repeat protein